MSKHTPGPWAYGQNVAQKRTGDQWDIGLSMGGELGVAGVLGSRGADFMLVGGICREADARLIAAAPDMLAALRLADRVFRVSVQEDGSTADHAARAVFAAIAKAEGEAA